MIISVGDAEIKINISIHIPKKTFCSSHPVEGEIFIILAKINK